MGSTGGDQKDEITVLVTGFEVHSLPSFQKKPPSRLPSPPKKCSDAHRGLSLFFLEFFSQLNVMQLFSVSKNTNAQSQPFKDGYPCNPSWEMASRLPPYLPPLRAKTTAAASAPRPDLQPVRILVPPKAVKVSYGAVRELVPSLWDESDEGLGRKIDLVVHIGM